MNSEHLSRENLSFERPSRHYVVLGLLFGLLLASPGPLKAADDAAIHPAAEEVLREMGEFLAGAEVLRVRAETSLDESAGDGFSVQRSSTVEFTVRRPDRLHAISSDPYPRKRMWYDGSTWSVLFLGRDQYSQTAVPGTLDAALDTMMDDYGVDLPMSDFFYSQPFEVLTEYATDGIYVGKALIDGELCHHLAFRQPGVDWQIWIADGGLPLPRKTVVTYTDESNRPQFTVHFSDWDLSTPATDGIFEFQPSPELEKIEFMPLSDLAGRSGQ